MTKKELIKAIDDIARKMDTLCGNIIEIKNDAQSIFSQLEDLPTEESEIDDSEETNED